jgi:hypothetical protein
MGFWNRRGTVNQHHDLKKAPTKVAKVMKKASKWMPKSIRNRICDGDVFGDLFWKPKAANTNFFGPGFGTLFAHTSKKHNKNRFKKSSKKRSPQNMKFDAKGIPKCSQNRCQNSSKINAKTGNEKDQENHQQSCFSEW